MSMQFPRGPFFVPPYEPEHGGVDFLGLRQANLEMMATCLPGINNVTSYVRAFSVLSWIHWKFHKLVAEKDQKEASHQALREFRERVEVLFTWGHVLEHLGGLPGTSAKTPPSDEGVVPLTFAAWKRSGANTSLMAPVQYGPASKTLGGLGFLEQVQGEFYRTCGEGVRLAEALEQELSHCDGVGMLGLEARAGSAEDASRLFPGWSILSPTREERAAFQRAFFDEGAAAEDSGLGRRSATVALARSILSWALRPMTLQEIRRTMAYARLPGSAPFEVPAHLLSARLRWSVLQVRQTQRFAHECLLVWLERRLTSGDRDSEALVSAALTALQNMLSMESGITVAEVSRRLVPEAESFDALCARAQIDGDACVFVAVERISEALSDGADGLVAHALRALLLCARAAEVLALEPVAERVMRFGGIERVSLKHWRETVARCREMPIREFLLLLFEGMLLSQHFAVAANRYDGGTQRLRITIEEEGLTLLADERWWPRLTADRLAAALSLAADCGLIKAGQDEVYEAA